MAFYLGIDSGGTKTRCVIADEHSVLASAITGGSNMVRLGEDAARKALHDAILQASSAARIVFGQVGSICVGAAGAARPEIAEKIRALIVELDSSVAQAHIEIVGDSVIALEAAFGPRPGVIAIAGTGSIVFGRDADGHTARAGGWGFAVSDEGSGQWIGRQAVAAALHAFDRQEQTALYAAILDAWKLGDLDALVRYANSTPAPEFQRLFPVILRTAQAGDSAAHELLTRAGNELAALAAIVIERITPVPPYVSVARTGSVFRQSAEVREVFYNRLQANFPGITVRQDSVEPVMGAIARARATGQRKAV